MRQPAWRWSLSRRKLFDLARRAGDYKARPPPDVVQVSRLLQPRARNRKAPNLFEDMTKLLDRKIVSTVAPKNRMNGKDDQTRKALLRLVVRRHANRLVVVGRIEFGAVAAQAVFSNMRLTSRSRDAGSRSVTTCPIPIITYQLTTSMPAGGKAL